MSEAELLARLRGGDDAAFAAIFREHYSGLVLAAARLLGERSEAEEIVQEVMLELWRRRERLEIAGQLRAYLHQSARNRALNRLRHRKTVRRAEPFVRPPSPSPRADDRISSRELQSAVRAAIAALSEPQREVFELSRLDDLTYPEIAAVLGISIKTVEARMGRALKALRAALAPWSGDGAKASSHE